ncbi:MAG TPA: flagellar FliJ family protein [Zeimonas sp.]
MKRRALNTLIEQAQRVRDDAALRVAGAHREAEAAQRTLDTLSSYRDEQMRNAAQRTETGVALLLVRERFSRKLDGAIDEQTRVRNGMQDAIERHRAELVERQQRLLAFRTLQARREALDARRRERIAQRETDEIAARSATRRNGEPK